MFTCRFQICGLCWLQKKTSICFSCQISRCNDVCSGLLLPFFRFLWTQSKLKHRNFVVLGSLFKRQLKGPVGLVLVWVCLLWLFKPYMWISRLNLCFFSGKILVIYCICSMQMMCMIKLWWNARKLCCARDKQFWDSSKKLFFFLLNLGSSWDVIKRYWVDWETRILSNS